MKPGPIGTFRASCNRLREDHKELRERQSVLEKFRDTVEGLPDSAFCSETFDNFPDAQAHMKAVHPKLFREQRRNEPKIAGARRQPWGRPAVKYEKQEIPPGTWFTTGKGHDAQVVGAVSASRTKCIAWLPEGSDTGKNNKAFRYWYLGADENDLWVWEFTVPTHVLKDFIAEGGA